MNTRSKIIFYLILLAVFIFLTVISIGSEIQKLIFPLIILILAMIANTVKLVALVKPSWGRAIDPECTLEGVGRLSPVPIDKEVEIDEDFGTEVVQTKLSLISVMLWVIFTVINYYLVGLVVATGLSVIIYMIVLCKEKWTGSLITAIVLPIVFYLGFNIALKMPLYQGWLIEKLL